MTDPTPPPDLVERVRRLEEALARVEAELARDPSRITPPSGTSAVTIAAPAIAVAADPPPPPPPMPGANEAREGAKVDRDLETQVGTYWLSRAGIAALITGIAFYISVHFGDFGAAARVALGYSVAAALSGLGFWIARRYRLFGELLFGGGLAVAYFVTYALHFVAAVRVIDSELVALVLLASTVLGIVLCAQRLRSETVAGIAMVLGLHASILGGTSALTLVANSLLACGALFFIVRNHWVIVPMSSLVAVYASHLAWAMRGDAFAPGQGSGERLAISLGSLLVYFATFNVVSMVRPRALAMRVNVALVLISWLGFVALGARDLIVYDRPSLVVFFVLTGVAMGLAGWAAARRLEGATAVVASYLSASLISFALASFEGLAAISLVIALTLLGVVGTMVGCIGALRAASDSASTNAGLALRGVGVILLVTALGATFALHIEGAAGPMSLAAAFVATAHVTRSRLARALTPAPLPAASKATQIARALDAIAAAGAACALVRTMTAIFPEALTTLAWTTAAVVMVALGLVLCERTLRLVGLGVVALGVARLFFFDLSGLPVDQRILTFVALGAALLALSFAYTKFRASIDRWS